MKKQDIFDLIKFWNEIEKNFYAKAHHLNKHYEDYLKEYGFISDNHADYESLARLIDFASKHKESI